MDKGKRGRKKISTPKTRRKKELPIGPRLRLEPVLNPRYAKQKNNLVKVSFDNCEQRSEILAEDVQSEQSINDSDEDIKCDDNDEDYVCDDSDRDYEDINDENYESNDSEEEYKHKGSPAKKKPFCEQSNYKDRPTEKFNLAKVIQNVQSNAAEKRKKKIGRASSWKDREVMDLVINLQSKGFADLKEIENSVKTRNEDNIRAFLKSKTAEKCQNRNSEKQRGRPTNKWTNVSRKTLRSWPNARKWRRLAYEQVLPHTQCKEYSQPIITALCKKFYEEEKESSDSEVINMKLIYKYMMDCVAGQVPPQLPPKESALVLDLLREVRVITLAYVFEEERKFLTNFKAATKFKPFEVKDEFKKQIKKEVEDDTSNTVPVPEKIFMELSRHKKLAQSFNPLVIPIWFFQKEQEFLEASEYF